MIEKDDSENKPGIDLGQSFATPVLSLVEFLNLRPDEVGSTQFVEVIIILPIPLFVNDYMFRLLS